MAAGRAAARAPLRILCTDNQFEPRVAAGRERHGREPAADQGRGAGRQGEKERRRVSPEVASPGIGQPSSLLSLYWGQPKRLPRPRSTRTPAPRSTAASARPARRLPMPVSRRTRPSSRRRQVPATGRRRCSHLCTPVHVLYRSLRNYTGDDCEQLNTIPLSATAGDIRAGAGGRGRRLRLQVEVLALR